MSFGRKKFRRFISGKKRFQPFFRKLHELSLAGLNFGGGDNVGNSGEKNVITYLRKHAASGSRPIVFDVGANAGIYTREVLSEFGDDAEVYCFEPLKKAFALLNKNIEGHPNIKTYNFGFGEKEGAVTIYANEASSPLASCFNRDIAHLGVDMGYAEEIPVRRLDIFCSENGISSIDLLKIDVEGGELGVLKGAGSLIGSGAIKLIQFEFGICNIDSRTFFKDFFFLLDPHYRIYRILKDGLEEVTSYSERDEIFLTTNYLAVLKD